MIPDRRPMVFSSPYGGLHGDNPYGLSPTWRTNPAAQFEFIRTLAGDCGGLKRMCISMGQGSLDSPNAYPASNQGLLAEFQPDVYDYYQNTFQVLPGEEWMVYTGLLMPVNGEQNSGVTAPANRVASDSDDGDFLQTALQLYGSIGFVEVGADLGNQVPNFIDNILPTKLSWCRKIISEAYPLVNLGPGDAPGGIRYGLDQTLISQRAYLALDWAYISSFDPHDEWVVDPNTTEVHAMVDNNVTRERLESLYNRGFIISPADTSPTIIEFMRSKYFSSNSSLRDRGWPRTKR